MQRTYFELSGSINRNLFFRDDRRRKQGKAHFVQHFLNAIGFERVEARRSRFFLGESLLLLQVKVGLIDISHLTLIFCLHVGEDVETQIELVNACCVDSADPSYGLPEPDIVIPVLTLDGNDQRARL